MPEPETESLTVDEFLRRHRLSENDFLVLAHDHPSLLPEVIDAGEGLRMLDLRCGSLDFYSALPALSRSLILTAGAGDILNARQFCDRYRVGAEGLLRLTLAGNLPQPYAHDGTLVFKLADIRSWERLNGLRLLQRLQAAQPGAVTP